MEFDCSNIDYIVKNIKNVPKFEFKKLKDDYKNIFAEGKSHYEADKEKKALVRCKLTKGYDDIELKEHIPFNKQYVV